ncbi:transcriptional regulator, HxlR family [Micromonospora inositola]|uniref:Transcriptional regulator, HxlR family n=1 Tax=Micromonospora inositola TaxID=47865 RepID=A0A1C5K513_9ACTN|nr:transcriptional regulator, HxlR family [Micromonospora inositola]
MQRLETVYDAVRLCGYRWSLEILTVLDRQRQMRFTDLQQTIRPTPSSKSLIDALRRLQDQGLVDRSTRADASPYQLTAAGQHLLPLLLTFMDQLQQWTHTYRDGAGRRVDRDTDAR